MGSQRAQIPVWASRKVGTPLSAEIPEPVRMVTLYALRNVSTRLSGISVTGAVTVI